MRARVITSARLRERDTWSADDWIFSPGDAVLVDGKPAVVARQVEDDLWVSYPELVPGTRTALAYTLPVRVRIDRVKRSRLRRRG